jgi:release factor glutamine methyltransferase
LSSKLIEVLKKTTQFFQAKGIPEARLQTEQLFAHVLGISRMDLYLQFDKPLFEDDLQALRAMVARKAKREPLQHIIGNVGFRHLDLKIDKRALIPRPDSEGLVDWVLEKCKNLVNPRVLEIGVGSGAVLLSIKKELPNSICFGTDISNTALSLAQENAQIQELEIHLEAADIWPKSVGEFDIIVSNPPYIPEAEWILLEAEVKEFDPKIALVAAEDGLSFYRDFFQKAKQYSTIDGYLICEFGYNQKTKIEKMAKAILPNNEICFRKDLGGHERNFCLRL